VRQILSLLIQILLTAIYAQIQIKKIFESLKVLLYKAFKDFL